MDRARELASGNRHHGPEASGRSGGAAAENGAHPARVETVIDPDDGRPLDAKDGILRRAPEALDAHTELRRERHEALRRGPVVALDTNGDQSKDQTAPNPPPGPRGRGFFRRRLHRIVAVVFLVSLVAALGIPLWNY